ncbi:SufD family Fe-S cluster assembly protein [Candidatus Peregrinibacteria bacterium]|nr:SufD family Fe-S cluster assembly protein [Candidatus Peregrinibacteria bacterium]
MNFKFESPSGEKTIKLLQDEESEIFLSDTLSGSRNFELHIFLDGNNAKVYIRGILTTQKSDKKEWKIFVHCKGSSQTASLDLKGVADGNSFLELSGNGILTKNSKEGAVTLREKVVLLSPNATVKALPILRVETENVAEASHSASITPFDEEMYFYLESRGINREEGKKLLLDGFLKY